MDINSLRTLATEDVGTLECKSTPSDKIQGFTRVIMEAHLPPELAQQLTKGIKELISLISGPGGTMDAHSKAALDAAHRIKAMRDMWLDCVKHNIMED